MGYQNTFSLFSWPISDYMKLFLGLFNWFKVIHSLLLLCCLIYETL